MVRANDIGRFGRRNGWMFRMTVASTFTGGAVRVMSLSLDDACQLGGGGDRHDQGRTRT